MKYLLLTLIISITVLNVNSQMRIEGREYKVILYETVDLITNETSSHLNTGVVEIIQAPEFDNSLIIGYEGSIGETGFICYYKEGNPEGDDFIETYDILYAPEGVTALIYYATIPDYIDGIKFDIILSVPDLANDLVHQIYLSNELVLTDFSKGIIQNKSVSENEFWTSLKLVFYDILTELDLSNLKGELVEGDDIYYWTTTIDLSNHKNKNEISSFKYSNTTSSESDIVKNQYIEFHVSDLAEWMETARSKEEIVSDILKVEKIIDELLPSSYVKVYNHYENNLSFAEKMKTTGAPNRKHIKDDVFWINESEVNVPIGALRDYSIQMSHSQILYNEAILSLKFVQPFGK